MTEIRFFVYAIRGEKLRAFYAHAPSASAVQGEISYLKKKAWRVHWRKAK